MEPSYIRITEGNGKRLRCPEACIKLLDSQTRSRSISNVTRWLPAERESDAVRASGASGQPARDCLRIELDFVGTGLDFVFRS